MSDFDIVWDYVVRLGRIDRYIKADPLYDGECEYHYFFDLDIGDCSSITAITPYDKTSIRKIDCYEFPKNTNEMYESTWYEDKECPYSKEIQKKLFSLSKKGWIRVIKKTS